MCHSTARSAWFDSYRHWGRNNQVTQGNTITEVLAALILSGNVPLQAVALAGESIAIDARLSDHEQGASRRASLEAWAALADANDILLRRTQMAVTDFASTRDGHALILALSEIKKQLSDL